MKEKLFFKRTETLLSLLPLFLLLCIAIFSRSESFSKNTIGDEVKFYEYAKNITNGYYAESVNPKLLEGPGYPLYLSIYAAFDAPFVLVRASNIILLILASWYLFVILQRYIKRRPALVLTYLFGLYPPMLRWANLMYAESLTLLLLLGFCYHFIIWYYKELNYKKHFLLAMFFLGYLALTKIIFAYVIIVALLGNLIFMVFKRIADAYQLKRTVLIFAGALVFFSPYVAYTYYMTGKFFYLGTHGGNILYFRSTPFDNEFGNSFSEWHVLKDIGGPEILEDVMVNMDQLRKNHGEFLASIDTLSWMEKDSIFKAVAIENMKNYPSKYLRNTMANVSRIFFHFPFSYRIQNMATLGYLIPNIFIVVLAILGIYPAFIRRKMIPRELFILLFLSLIYLGGHTLLGGRGRFLIPVVPIWLMFFSFIYFNILQIRIKNNADNHNPSVRS